MDQDKLSELARYDTSAQFLLESSGVVSSDGEFGSDSMPHYLRSPYTYYQDLVAELIHPQDRVLEVGAGTGLHTCTLVKTGAYVTATDISPNSLKLLAQRIKNAGAEVTTQVADMEKLPFSDNSFDMVACAGSLSYGEPLLVDTEIKRVLCPGGLLICVDSLNHNPIYRFNRFLHHLRGDRTKSTLRRMPDLSRIKSLSVGFESFKVQYYGAVTFIMPLMVRLIGQQRAQSLSDSVDRVFHIKHAAFKFVFVAKNFQKIT